MTADSHVTIHKSTAAVAAVILLSAGAGATYLLTRGSDPASFRQPSTVGPTDQSHAAHSTAKPLASAAAPSDVVISLSQDAIARAGIVLSAVGNGASRTELRLPGSVQPNGYRQVAVTPLVAGRITSVAARLGDRVRRGQPLAELQSPLLAEAETRYISA